jgi:hypothetical protein
MARRGEAKGAVRVKARALPREERQKSQEGPKRVAQEGVKQARARPGSAKVARTKPGGAKAGRAKAGRARTGGAKAARAKGAAPKVASGRDDANIESRLVRLEQAVALQTERSDELLEKIESVLADSNEPRAASAGSST